MGLESLELVVDIEDSFGIVISDGEAQAIRTAGQLRNLVLSRLSDSRACGSMIAFNRLRRGIQVAARVPRREVRPETRLDELLPVLRRRSAWALFATASQLKLPKLRKPLWVLVVIGLATLASAVAAYQVGAGIRNAIFAGALSWFLLVIASGATAVLIPAGHQTIGELAGALAARYPVLSASTRPAETEVWSKIVDSIARVTGVDPARITPETNFVDDLGF